MSMFVWTVHKMLLNVQRKLFWILQIIVGANAIDNGCSNNWMVGNNWEGSHEAHLVFEVDHDVHNWEVTMLFDMEVEDLTIWMAKWETDDHFTFRYDQS